MGKYNEKLWNQNITTNNMIIQNIMVNLINDVFRYTCEFNLNYVMLK